jgi:hypothetical protein
MKRLLIIVAVSAAFISTAQNVGINTDGTTPTQLLHIKTGGTNVPDGILINNTGGTSADAVIKFQNNGTAAWTLGFDDSDLDEFKISQNNLLGSTNAFTINSVRQVMSGITGTETVPAWTFEADPNTGLWQNNVDELMLSAGGREFLTLDEGGATNNTATFNIDGDDMDFRIESDDVPNMFFVNGNDNRVGIGTAAPVDRFHVSGGRVEFTNTDDANGTAGSGVLEIGNSLRIDGNEVITNTNTILYLNNDNNGDVRMDGSTFAMDASTNRVGIGTAAPAEELHVVGDARVSTLAGVGNRIVIADANGTLNDVAPGTNGQVLTQTAAGPAYQSSTNINSVSNTADLQISTAGMSNVAGMTLTFTATQTTALLMFSASGFAYGNSMAYVGFRIRNGATSLGGTTTNMQSYDDVTGTLTLWSCTFTKMITGLTIGTAYTYTLQGQVNGILGTPNAAIYTASNPDTHHLTMSIIQ